MTKQNIISQLVLLFITVRIKGDFNDFKFQISSAAFEIWNLESEITFYTEGS
jgi:hypothetical protein